MRLARGTYFLSAVVAIGLISMAASSPGITGAAGSGGPEAPVQRSDSTAPAPPRLPANFNGRGRYLVPDLGIDVPFGFRANRGNVKMVAGGRDYPIWFMNLIYGKRLYTVTYRWPGLVDREPCAPIPGRFTLKSLNGILARSMFVGKEILEGTPNRRVNHFRVAAVLPSLPPGSFVRLPFASADVYVDRGSPDTFRKVLHFGLQNLFDPALDEWFEMDTFRHTPGQVTLPRGCPSP